MKDLIVTAILAFVAFQIGFATFLGILRLFGVYTIVEEGTAVVYTVFGKVRTVIDDPGFCFLPFKLLYWAPIIKFVGERYVVDRRLDQEYLRSQPVNSEEGAPMGVGIWYEMSVSDPVAFLFKNTDPRGSLRANVSNAAVRCLSNLKLASLLENRHAMSQTVRKEVSPKSDEWGYRLGSVYIRKVHFRDREMIKQIEAKVVNRLRQVTSAIRQDGTNQVAVIKSTAEKQAAVEFARAAGIRPQVIGLALKQISVDPEVARALFDILETQKLLEGGAAITLLPEKPDVLTSVAAAGKLTT